MTSKNVSLLSAERQNNKIDNEPNITNHTNESFVFGCLLLLTIIGAVLNSVPMASQSVSSSEHTSSNSPAASLPQFAHHKELSKFKFK